jgi:hypothetical protein
LSGGRIFAGCALAALLLGGCSRMSMMPLHTELGDPRSDLQSAQGRPITGFVTSDGAYHRFQGWVTLEGDSLVFHRPHHRNDHDDPPRRIAATEVTTLFGKEFDTGLAVGISVGVALLCGLALLAVSLVAGGGLAGN